MDRFTSALELLGAALFVVGLFLWSVPVGFIGAGVVLVAVGYLAAPDPERPSGDRR